MPKDDATKKLIGGATPDARVKGVATGRDELDEESLAKVSGGKIGVVEGEAIDIRHPREENVPGSRT